MVLVNINLLGQKTPSSDNPGWYSEASVYRILYDLYDDHDDGADRLSLGFAPMHKVLIDAQKNTNAFTSIFSFITALKAQNPDDKREDTRKSFGVFLSVNQYLMHRCKS